MKRFGLLMILILTVTLVSGAQAQGTAFGLKAGISFANLKGDNTDNLDSRTGFMIGGFAALPLSPAAAIQPELFYVQKGTKFTEDAVDFSLKLEYLEIPVLFKYTVAGETAAPYFLVGPSLGFNLSSKVKAEDRSQDYDYVTDTDWGLVFGLGMNIQQFLLEFRYTLGLSDINDFPDDPDSIKNSAFAMLGGITF